MQLAAARTLAASPVSSRLSELISEREPVASELVSEREPVAAGWR